MNTTFAVRLRSELGILQRIARTKWPRATATRELYAEYLTQTYHYVVASVPLMRLARRAAVGESLKEYRLYLDHHIREEEHHATWLLEDLHTLSSDGLSAPSPEAMSLAGIGYYAINHCRPLSLLGYMYALESSPLSVDALRDLQARCGLSNHDMRTLAVHSENDPHHREELDTVLCSHWVTGEVQSQVTVVATATLRAGIQLLDSMISPTVGCHVSSCR